MSTLLILHTTFNKYFGYFIRDFVSYMSYTEPRIKPKTHAAVRLQHDPLHYHGTFIIGKLLLNKKKSRHPLRIKQHVRLSNIRNRRPSHAIAPECFLSVGISSWDLIYACVYMCVYVCGCA